MARSCRHDPCEPSGGHPCQEYPGADARLRFRTRDRQTERGLPTPRRMLHAPGTPVVSIPVKQRNRFRSKYTPGIRILVLSCGELMMDEPSRFGARHAGLPWNAEARSYV